MTLSPQRLEKAAEAAYLRNRAGSTDWKDISEKHRSEWRERVAGVISAYLGYTHVDVPREPTGKTLDAIVEECMAAWGVNSGGKEKPRPIMWKSEWRERARPFYRAMLSAHQEDEKSEGKPR
jgi:hypothetical protein